MFFNGIAAEGGLHTYPRKHLAQVSGNDHAAAFQSALTA
jgi:hypothetical protein